MREKQVVAIKQLNPEFATSMMADFVYLSYNATSREDGTLVKVFGTTLATPANPMALITEFYERGPLNLYLKGDKNSS